MNQQPPVALTPFDKPWCDLGNQLQVLKNRGLVVGDPAAAEKFLAHVNYYRLSGYCLAFERDRHQFYPGTTFERIRASYEFDLAIRDLLSEALEVVEVDVRTATAYHFGQKYAAYGHTNASSFFNAAYHSDWLEGLRLEVGRSKELFVFHFRNKYTRFPDLPIWVATEVMSFGTLSRMLRGMHRKDLIPITGRYGIKDKTLTSWTHHLSYVRNLCAHHSRVWDRVWSIRPDLPPAPGWLSTQLSGNSRLACTLLILYRMLLRCPAIGSFAADWKAKADTLLARPPEALRAAILMGMVPPLSANPLWTATVQA